MERSAFQPSSVLTVPNSDVLNGPAWDLLEAQRVGHAHVDDGRAEQVRPGRDSAADEDPAGARPSPARCAGEVSPSSTRRCAQAMKSRIVFGLVASLPAVCHASPSSPPPRGWQVAMIPLRSSHARSVGVNHGSHTSP